MSKWIFLGVGLVLGLGASQLISEAVAQVSEAVAGGTGVKPAYLVVSGRTLSNADLAAYRAAATPLAEAAGLSMLARRDSIPSEHILEGKWPYSGFVAVERFTSMEMLLEFWHSPGYQAAKRLREQKMEIDFIVALEGM